MFPFDDVIMTRFNHFSFYIILRGTVSVYLKEDNVDMLSFDKHSETLKESDKAKLGIHLGNMGGLWRQIRSIC